MADLVFAFAVPVGHQHDPRLKLALRSIAQQDVRITIGISAVNETQECKDIISAYADTVNYQRHGPDTGQSAAINESWRHIQGDIYAWLNIDDYLVPGALTKVKSIFKNDPDIDVVFGQSYIIEKDQLIGMHSEVRPMSADILSSNIISQPSCFVRRKALFDIGLLNPNLHYTMDWDLWTRLYNSGAKFHYLPDVLSVVSWDAYTKTASLSWARYREIFALSRKYSGTSTATRTGISFLLEHLSQYGVLKAVFSKILGHVRKEKGLPLKRWFPRDANKRAVSEVRNTLTICLSHYRDQPIRSVSLGFSTSVKRQFIVNKIQVAQTKDKTVSLPLIVRPSEVSYLSVVKIDDGEFGLDYVQLH